MFKANVVGLITRLRRERDEAVERLDELAYDRDEMDLTAGDYCVKWEAAEHEVKKLRGLLCLGELLLCDAQEEMDEYDIVIATLKDQRDNRQQMLNEQREYTHNLVKAAERERSAWWDERDALMKRCELERRRAGRQLMKRLNEQAERREQDGCGKHSRYTLDPVTGNVVAVNTA